MKKQFNKVQTAQAQVAKTTSNGKLVESVSLRADAFAAYKEQLGLDVDSIGSVSKQSNVYTGMTETFEKLVDAREDGSDEIEYKALKNKALLAAILYQRITGSYVKRSFDTTYASMEAFNTQTLDGLGMPLRKVIIAKAKLDELRKAVESFDFVGAILSDNLELIKKSLNLIKDAVRAYDMYLQQHIDAFKKAYTNVRTLGNVSKHGGTVELTKKLNTIRVQNNLDFLELADDEILIGNVVIQAHAGSIEKNNKIYVSGSLNDAKQIALTEKVPEMLNMLVKVAQEAKMPSQVIDIAKAAIKKNPMLASAVSPIADLVRVLKEEADEDYRFRIQGLDFHSEDSEQLVKDERQKSQKKFLELREIALSWLAVLASKDDKKSGKELFKQLTHAELNAVVSVLGSHFPSDIGTGSNELAVSMAQRVFLYRELHRVLLESILTNKEAYGVAGFEDNVIADNLENLIPVLGEEYKYFDYMEAKATPSELAQTIPLNHGARFEFVEGKNPYFANTMQHDGVYELCIIDPLTEDNPSKYPKFKLMIETTALFEQEIQRQITDFGNRYLVTFPLDARDLKDSHRYVKDEEGKIYVERSEEVKQIDAFNEAIQKDTHDRAFFTLDMVGNGSGTVHALYSVNKDFRENGIKDIRVEFTLNAYYSNISKYLKKEQEGNYAAKMGSNVWIDPIYVAYTQSKDSKHQRGSFVGTISETSPTQKLTKDEQNLLGSAILAMPEHTELKLRREASRRAKTQDEVLEVQQKQEEFLNRHKPGMGSFAQPKKKVVAQVKSNEELLLEQKNREKLEAIKQQALASKVSAAADKYNPFANDDDDDDEL